MIITSANTTLPQDVLPAAVDALAAVDAVAAEIIYRTHERTLERLADPHRITNHDGVTVGGIHRADQDAEWNAIQDLREDIEQAWNAAGYTWGANEHDPAMMHAVPTEKWSQ